MRRISDNFRPEDRDRITPDLRAQDPLRGLNVNPTTGDITTAAAFMAIREVAGMVWDALGYVDIIEQDTLATTRGLGHAREEIATVQAQITDLRARLDRLVDFLGVPIPAWANKGEVENGDDMGISSPSDASLELTVNFQFERQVAGFGHEDVIRIDPPAGTLVKRGSSVTVTLNLEG